MDVKMKMPDLSNSADEITVIEWLVAPGQPVKRGEGLLEVETDKATMEVESIATGILKTQNAQPGDVIPAGQVIAIIEAEAGATGMIGTTDEDSSASQVSSSSESAKPTSRTPRTPGGMFARNRHAAGGSGDAEASISMSVVQRTVARRMPRSATEISVDRMAAYDRNFLLGLYERMVCIREFEDGVKFLFLEGAMPGTIHQCQGQEATAVGVCAALREEDFITSTFRGHGHALAKGLTPEELLFELFGASTGCCKGKGGSMHVGDMSKGMVPAIAIVGGSIPLASGMALAFKMKKTSQVVACFFGDGATSEGAFHEGITLAAIWDLPVIFVCENNLYGASTRIDKVTRLETLAEHGAGYGIRSETVDGNDVLAVFEAARQAADECRNGQGPVLLELLTYRRTGHSRRDACNYQASEEKNEWFGRDPIEVLGRGLVKRADVDEQELDGIRTRVARRFGEAVEAAKQQSMPGPEDLVRDVYA